MNLGKAATRIAAAAGALAAAAILAVAAPAANATVTPTHVGLVVAGQGSYCVDWHSGMSALDVVAGSGLNLVVSQQANFRGFVTTIGSVTWGVTADHYWAYYQLQGTNWHYSDLGAGAYQPKAGDVDGWAVSPNGGPNVDPPVNSYASICAGRDAPVAPPAPPASTPAAPVKSTTKIAAPATSAVDPSQPSSVDSAAPTTASSDPGSSSSAESTPTALTTSAPEPSTAVSLTAGSKKPGSGSPVPLIVGISLILVLAGAGGFTAWRRRT